MAREYTEDEKGRALAIYTHKGAEAAATETGIPSGTIRSWASREGVVPMPGAVPVQAEVVRRKWAESRAGEADEAGEVAMTARRKALELLDEGKILDAQRAALTYAIMGDKADKWAGAGAVGGQRYNVAQLDQAIEGMLSPVDRAHAVIDEIRGLRGPRDPRARLAGLRDILAVRRQGKPDELRHVADRLVAGADFLREIADRREAGEEIDVTEPDVIARFEDLRDARRDAAKLAQAQPDPPDVASPSPTVTEPDDDTDLAEMVRARSGKAAEQAAPPTAADDPPARPEPGSDPAVLTSIPPRPGVPGLIIRRAPK